MLCFTTSILGPVEYVIHSMMEITFSHLKKKGYFCIGIFSNCVQMRFGNGCVPPS